MRLWAPAVPASTLTRKRLIHLNWLLRAFNGVYRRTLTLKLKVLLLTCSFKRTLCVWDKCHMNREFYWEWSWAKTCERQLSFLCHFQIPLSYRSLRDALTSTCHRHCHRHRKRRVSKVQCSVNSFALLSFAASARMRQQTAREVRTANSQKLREREVTAWNSSLAQLFICCSEFRKLSTEFRSCISYQIV